MKIVLVTSMFPPYCGGGVSSHVYDLALGLKEKGHTVMVLTSRRGKQVSRAEDDIKGLGIRVCYSDSFPSMILNFLRILGTKEYELYHLHSFNAGILSIFRFLTRKKSFLLTVHSDTANFLASTKNWSKHNPFYILLRLVEVLVVRLVGNIIAVDKRLEIYTRKLGAKKLWRLSNSVDTHFFSPKTEGYSNPRNDGFILCPRMLVPKNGVAFAIEAIACLSASTDVKLVIAGDGPLRPELESRAKEISSNRIKFLGECDRTQMRNLYRDSEIVLVPSVTSKGLQEATSISALEAMACGKPVIASNIGGLRELIDNHETGYLVDEGKPEAIARRIIELLEDNPLRQRIGNQAREKVLNEFSREQWIQKIERIYQDI